MKLRSAAVVFLIASTLTGRVSACADLATSSGDVDLAKIAVQIEAAQKTTLRDNPAPPVKAAGDSAKALDKVDQAIALSKEAVDTNGNISFPKIDQAIALNPNVPNMRLRKAALQVANGESTNPALGEAYDLSQKLYEGDPEYGDYQYIYSYLLILANTSQEFAPSSQARKRVVAEYCRHVAFFTQKWPGRKNPTRGLVSC